jgi:hypothetical protein
MEPLTIILGVSQLGGQLLGPISYFKDFYKEFKNAAENYSKLSADLKQVSQVA